MLVPPDLAKTMKVRSGDFKNLANVLGSTKNGNFCQKFQNFFFGSFLKLINFD